MARRNARNLLVAVAFGLAVSGCAGADATDAATSPPAVTEQPADEAVTGDDAASEETAEGAHASGEAVPEDDAETDDAAASADDAGDWTAITDPGGARFSLPSPAETRESTAVGEDGSEVALRNYAAVTPDGVVEVGFNIIDTPGETYDLDAGVAGVAKTLDADVVSSLDTEVDGNPAVDVELSYGDDRFVLFQLITTDEHVMQTLASGPASERAAVEATFQQLNDSLATD